MNVQEQLLISTTKLKTKFDLLRSHWTLEDQVWIACSSQHRKKLLANFCYFGPAINTNIVNLYPNKEKSICIKIIIPEELILMNSSHIQQYFELEIYDYFSVK